MRKKLLTKLKHEKEACRRVKQEQETQQEYKGTVQACRIRIRKAKPHLEVNLARDVKGNKGFHKYSSSKKTIRENDGSLLNGAENLVTKDMQKIELLSVLFTLVFAGKVCLEESQGL